MFPPGRQKSYDLGVLSLLVSILFFNSVSAVSAVVGIDLGTEYIKAAIAKPGSPIEIVLTKDSKRKEAAAIAFKPSRSQSNDPDAFPERLYGGDALALSARFPSDVYQNLKSVLGLASDSQGVKDYLNRYPGLQQENVRRSSDESSGSSLAFKSQSLSKNGVFMVEELLAMELKNIKANAETAVGKGGHVSDVVITIPPFYTAEEKRAIEFAADLAGLRVLGLISDGMAVGLNYATQRTFESVSQGGKPEHHVVYDMGAGSTTATVLKFQGRTIKGPGKRNTTFQEVQVLGYGSDRTLGGDSLNDLIVHDMVKKFIVSPKVKPHNLPAANVLAHGKTMARLWKDAEKVRQVLSANSVAHASLEGLFYEDVNFKYSLNREEFEALARDHAARVAGPLNQALLMADLRIEDINSVILHGGLIRTPFIQKQLEDIAGVSAKLKTNVNADEAAVLGAAFRAASISPAYRVKDIRGADISGATYAMSWTQDSKRKEQKIFVPTSQAGVEKQLTVKAQEDTSVDFKLETLSGSYEILSVELTNLTKSVSELKEKHGCVPANITTSFTMRLNPVDAIPELYVGSVSCKPEKEKEGSVIDSVKGILGFGKKDQEPLQGEDDNASPLDDPSASIPLPVSDPTSSGTIVSSPSATDNSSSATSTTKSAKTKPTPTLVTIPLSKNNIIKGLNQPPLSELPAIRKRLSSFDNSDQDIVSRAEALNLLEGFTYRARDYIDDESFIAVSTDKVRKELQEQLSSVSEWLYGDGVDAKLEDFRAKLKGLQSIIDPVLKRKDEGNKRDAAIETLKGGLTGAEGLIEMVKTSIEKAAKDAASSASSVASAASEKISSAASPSSDGAELEEDPYTKTAPADVNEIEDLLPKVYEYTAEDLSSISKAYDSAKKWLEEKVAAQKKLKPYEDPAMLVADIEAKAAQLQKTVTNMIMKQIKLTPPPKAKKPKATKKDKAKSKKSKSTTPASGTAASQSTTSIKDEL